MTHDWWYEKAWCVTGWTCESPSTASPKSRWLIEYWGGSSLFLTLSSSSSSLSSSSSSSSSTGGIIIFFQPCDHHRHHWVLGGVIIIFNGAIVIITSVIIIIAKIIFNLVVIIIIIWEPCHKLKDNLKWSDLTYQKSDLCDNSFDSYACSYVKVCNEMNIFAQMINHLSWEARLDQTYHTSAWIKLVFDKILIKGAFLIIRN